MKFTIFNYSSPAFLQPLYFKTEISKIAGCEAYLINETNNVYYTYDTINPEYSIVNAGMDLNSLIHYNKHSGNKIKHILNIDYIKDKYLDDIKLFLKSEKDFNCSLVFSSNFKHKNIDFGVPYLYVSNCADNNIPESEKLFNIEMGVVVTSKKDIKEYKSNTYHNIAISNEVDNTFGDFSVNNIVASKLFKNYDEIIIRNINPNNIPEVFFNALYFGKRVYFDNDNNVDEVNESIKRIFNKEFVLDYNEHIDYNVSELKEIIKSKYLPRNKIKQLLSNVPNTSNVLKEL